MGNNIKQLCYVQLCALQQVTSYGVHDSTAWKRGLCMNC